MVVEKDAGEDESLRIAACALRTQRLLLRAPQERDCRELAALADNRRIAEMLARLPHPYGLADARAFVAAAAGPRRGGIVFAVTLAASEAFLGCAALEATERGLEIGYWLGEPYWGCGFATEAAHALVDLAFEATATSVLHGSCRTINPASRRVLHKCGFQYAGQGMMTSPVAGKVPVERYRLDRRTWTSLRNWKHV